MGDEDSTQDQQRKGPRGDEAWKKAVAEEREGLRETAKEDEEAAPSAGGEEAAPAEGGAEPRERELPAPDFQTFLAGLYTQTLIALGAVQNPMSKKTEKSLPEASFLIDTIDMLRLKTQGNLSAEEESYLNALLHDLRIRYVGAAGEGGQ